MAAPTVAVIGGGINGAGIAWELARKGYVVTIFEKSSFGGATSSATTKLIHGGLRYLEYFEFGLVRESLRERAFLLEKLPQIVHALEIVTPSYFDDERPMWFVSLGLTLYDLLGGWRLGRHRRLSAAEVGRCATIRPEGLVGGFSFLDAQVDDAALVRTVIRSALRDGVAAREHCEVVGLDRDSSGWRVETNNAGTAHFDLVVAVTGPWMASLLESVGLRSPRTISLVRGSHIVLDRRISDVGFLLPSPGEKRVFFVLPWKGKSLLGTTEVVHYGSLDAVLPSEEEIAYLLERHNNYFRPSANENDIATAFAGVRPLIGSAIDPSVISREYRVDAENHLILVFGGTMTTFMSLARKVGDVVDREVGQRHKARTPLFDV